MLGVHARRDSKRQAEGGDDPADMRISRGGRKNTGNQILSYIFLDNWLFAERLHHNQATDKGSSRVQGYLATAARGCGPKTE